ncbi:MAG: serine hydrolase [Nanoarchaeota archaeon]|nr:serine hydrolase [Nanoarchaeota archaeon]
MDEIKSSENAIPKEVIKESKKRIKISKKTIFTIILILSLTTNIIFILSVSVPELTGNVVSEQHFKLIKLQEKVPIDSNIKESSILHYDGLRTEIEKEIEKYNVNGSIGLFLQDVNTGTWMGINERAGFTPASLLKIPIMIAILKKVERQEIKLTDRVTLTEEDLDENYGDLYKKGAGTKMSIAELLEEMTINSDNTAQNALRKQLSVSELDAIFIHLGVPDPYLLDNDHVVSPRNYIRFFKALYFSTFLSPEFSERALDLTTDTQEENLIAKEIPPEVQVAHKFGIIREEFLHDCGIVYHQENPYFLCIMTKNMVEKSYEFIPKISKDIYDFVDRESNN